MSDGGDSTTAEDVPPQRGEGDVAFPSKDDIKLWRRALRENWPLSADDRNQIVRDVMDYFILSQSGRDKLNAAKVLMLADALNVKRASMIGVAHKANRQQVTPVSVNLMVQNTVGQAVATEPEYLEWLRERSLAETGNSDAVGQNGHGGNLPDNGAHPGNGSGDNGHTPGNGRH